MATCCERTIKTTFCPYCGARFRGAGPMGELLTYIDERIRVHSEDLSFIDSGSPVPVGPCTSQTGKGCPRKTKEATIARWETWRDVLEKLLADRAAPNPKRKRNKTTKRRTAGDG